MESFQTIDQIVNAALAIAQTRDRELLSALDQIPAPIYVTDADGVVTYFNPACVGFAGRTPVAGKDRWCVTWKLFTDSGEPLPHDRCPMADAIVQKILTRIPVPVVPLHEHVGINS